MVAGDLCKSRWCVPCATARSKLIQRNLVPFVRERKIRFITFTLKHKDRPLSTQVTRIWRCFKELRTTAEFKQNVLGFVAFLECKRNPQRHTWHVHLHVLAEGSFWDQKEISKLWLEATGDSMIVDIQAKGTSATMAYYGAKYASKPINPGDMESAAIHAEAIFHLARRRLWLIGGIWKGKLKLLAKGEDPGDWKLICSVNSLFERGRAGEAEALSIIQRLLCGDERRSVSVDNSS